MYISGCLGLHPQTKSIVPGGIAEQTRMALTNLKNIVEESGSTMNQIVKCTCLLADMSYFPEFNAIYIEYFPTSPPARTTFAVLGLPLGGLVEVDAICIAN
jgi:2-iminobutanoate/2-iminopropanoate deaminase